MADPQNNDYGVTTSVLNTEQFFPAAPVITGKNMVFGLNLRDMKLSTDDLDEIVVRIYSQLSKDTDSNVDVAYTQRFRGPQVDPIKFSVPLPAIGYWQASVEQVAGRPFDYEHAVIEVTSA